MVQTIAVNESNDLYLDKDGNIAIARDLLAILQICSQVAKARLGEMVLNTDQGLPYFETVFNGSPNVQQFTASLRAALLNVEGVIEVVSLITSQIENTFIYNAVIRTTFGSGAIQNG